MSENLSDAIEKAADTVLDQEKQAAAATPRKGANSHLISKLVILFILIGITIVAARKANRLAEAELSKATIQTLQLADSDITEFYTVNRILPVALEDFALQELVTYRQINLTQYELVMRFGPFTNPLQRTIDQPLSHTALEAIIQ